MDLKKIAARYKAGERISPEEFAYLLRNDREAFMAFLITNNPGSMNNILRHQLGYTFELDFTPSIPKLQRVVQTILDRGDQSELLTIINNFQLDTKGLTSEVAANIQSLF